MVLKTLVSVLVLLLTVSLVELSWLAGERYRATPAPAAHADGVRPDLPMGSELDAIEPTKSLALTR